MTDACPFLEYRDGDAYPTERAYCAAAERFVQPMRADVCNGRYGLDHATDCEIFRAHADEVDAADASVDTDTNASTAATDGEITDGESEP